jgi:hypothetical protein
LADHLQRRRGFYSIAHQLRPCATAPAATAAIASTIFP